MEEKLKDDSVQPQTEEEILNEKDEATTPDLPSPCDSFMKIKFNKEILDLDRETAVSLAQKGMKFDQIYEDYEKLRAQAESPDNFGQLRIHFPEISSPDMLPEEVKTAAKNNGTGLVFEYLLYEYKKAKAAAEETENQCFTAASTTGSLSADDRQDPTAAEFLKGVWGN